jgi:c(7)-type cytochrome triheme protein
MPEKDRCMTCHEQLDTPDRPKEKTVAGFLDPNGRPVWSAFTRQSDEIVFSHKVHADRKIACADCHGPLVQDKGLTPDGKRMSMAACSACHAERAPAKNECRTCHQVLDRTVAPENHRRQWGPTHGLVSRLGAAGGAAADCALCHRQDSCTTCHQTQAPGDHTNFWRLRAHGVASGLDRSRCQVCHRSDMCDRCHQQSAPLSHTGLFGAPRHQHCTGCHLPVQAAVGGCATCHQSTPSHALVPPWPAWHTVSLNCRSCHAATMKHPDNGQACTLCHR